MTRLERAKSHFENILISAQGYLDSDLFEPEISEIKNNISIASLKGRENLLISRDKNKFNLEAADYVKSINIFTL